MSLDQLMRHLARHGVPRPARPTWREALWIGVIAGLLVGAAAAVVLSGPNLVGGM